MDIKTYIKRRRDPFINVVPLIDVLMVIIFFFLLTMQFKNLSAIDITPPTMKSSETALSEKYTTISINKDGQIFLQDEKLTPQELLSALEKLHKENENMSLVLVADETSPLKFVTEAIDQVRLAKIKKLSLQTKKTAQD